MLGHSSHDVKRGNPQRGVILTPLVKQDFFINRKCFRQTFKPLSLNKNSLMKASKDYLEISASIFLPC